MTSWQNPNNAATQGNNLDTGVAFVRLPEGKTLSRAQAVDVKRQFEAHKRDLTASLPGYQIREYKLPDGTRMRVQSNSGIHNINVWPAEPNPVDWIPHGLAVRSNWAQPVIYARVPGDSVQWNWSRYAPQVAEYENITYDQVLRPADQMVHPIVLNLDEKFGWDWVLHNGYTGTIDTGDWIVPVSLEIQEDDYEAHRAHVAVNDAIHALDGTELYAVEPSDEILLVDPEEQVALPGTSDSSGNQCALQHYRVAEISPSFDIWQFRFCNEVLERTTVDEYTQVERNVVDIVTPLDETTATVTNVNDNSLGVSISDDDVFATYSTVALAGAGWDGFHNASWVTGYTQHDFDVSSYLTITEVAGREIVEQATDTETVTKLIAVGGNTSIDHVSMMTSLNYIRDVLWRGGSISTGYDRFTVHAAHGITGDRFGVHRYTKYRKDMHYWLDGQPLVTLNLGFTNYKILEGTTTGRCDGTYSKDVRVYHGQFPHTAERTHVTSAIVDPGISGTYAHNNDERPYLMATYYDVYNTTTTGVEAETILFETGTRPTNSGEYSLTSRHIIDYDHRGRFVAAIKVVVECSGAEWEEDTGVYDGYMQASEFPDYTVNVYFESNWNGTVNSTLLTSATGTHPAWEFITLTKMNPYYYPPTPSDISAGRDNFYVRIPPVITPGEDAMRQIANLAIHQGVNSRIACQDIRDDLAEPPDSDVGIEFSAMVGGVETKHFKRATGQLYARTFNIATDFPEALWLLHSTKVSARENDDVSGDQYFYFDGLKAALETTYHVEVRDGVHVQWSDTLGSDDDRPDPDERELELYQV